MFRITKVAVFVSLLAVAGMPAQAARTGAGDTQVQGMDIGTGTPAGVDRTMPSGAELPLVAPHLGGAGDLQAGGNSGGMMTDAFGGTGVSSSIQVPEPGTIILGGLGTLMLIVSRATRRSRRD